MSQSVSSYPHRTSKFPQYFWVLFVVLGVAFAVLFLDHFRVYVSQMTLLVKYKSEQSLATADETLDNLMALPETVAFYDQLLSRYPEIHDPWKGLSQDKRQALWAEHVRVERQPENGFVTLSVTADTAEDAAVLSKKVALNLIQSMGVYYDIRTDAEAYITNGPITSTEIYNPLGWLMLSVGLAFVSALAFASGVEKVFGGIDTRLNESMGGSVSEKIQSLLMPSDEDFEVARSQMSAHAVSSVAKVDKEETFSEEKTEEKSVAPIEAIEIPQPAKEVAPVKSELVASQKEIASHQYEKTVPDPKPLAFGPGRITPSDSSTSAPVLKPNSQTASVKASTPRNLPFLEEGMSLEQYLFQNVTPQSKDEKVVPQKDMKVAESPAEEAKPEEEKNGNASRQEPTDEELKRRLNQLLRGEI